jgi:hypothetical protein
MYDISTTALYTEPVSVCIDYDVADFGGGTPSVRLLHFDGSEWLDITTLNNPFSSPARLCSSEVEGFSLFAVAVASSGMAPEAYIISGPEGPLGPEGLPTSTSGSATFEFWVDQPDAIAQCSLDGEPFFFCESPVTVGPLEEGGHEFMVQAINEFGWMDLTPALYEWEVLGPDVTPPSTVITNGPPEGSSTPNFISTFEFSGTDDFTMPLELDFQCTLDGVDLGNCETPEQIEVTTPGEHTLVVQAIDAAGNVDPVGATRHWTPRSSSAPRRRRPRRARPSSSRASSCWTARRSPSSSAPSTRASSRHARRRTRFPGRWPAVRTSSTSARSIPTATGTSPPRSTSG